MGTFMDSPVMVMLSDPVLYLGLGQGLLLTLQIAGISIALSLGAALGSER